MLHQLNFLDKTKVRISKHLQFMVKLVSTKKSFNIPVKKDGPVQKNIRDVGPNIFNRKRLNKHVLTDTVIKSSSFPIDNSHDNKSRTHFN
ncbi:hypothetical protein XELAEV_18026068mg [Xenopus laevis]|uniref:Uncharacterized protein n=1 Tax=Xenopus laevis TaxID=8355 RepID=A0A974CTW9_XENLA|nr:hypothetical protein XELAEV_18026068mg [Xenopus laevis]